MARRAAWLLLPVLALGSCTQIVRYTDELVDARYGRTLFTQLPSTVGATAGFALGLPIVIVVSPAAWVFYRSQPPETRDPISVFLFPSFVLWKAGALLGAPFDLVEWGLWRSWQPDVPITQDEREAIERAWDSHEYTEYPLTPFYPLDPVPPGRSEPPR